MIALVDYRAGNVFSVTSALERLGAEVVLTRDADVILSADRVVFPGVGYAKSAMDELEARGLLPVLRAVRRPFLGICLGMQLMCSHSDEGDTELIGIVDASVERFDAGVCRKIPQIGWNRILRPRGPLFDGIRDGEWFFFDHSYYVPLLGDATVCETEYYGFEYTSALGVDNFYGVQFHPEKSGKAGERLLANFLEL